MKKGIYLVILLSAVLPLGGCNPENIVKVFFSEPKRFSSEKNGNTLIQPSGTTQGQPVANTLLDKQKLENLFGNLEKLTAAEPDSSQPDSFPDAVVRPANAADKITWLPPPPGFMTADTYNYLIYREQDPVTAKIKTVLNEIHGNLMLDLTPFTLVAKPNKILVMLFNKRESYMDFTKRPAWSGASSNLQSDSVYLVEAKGIYPLTVHEMTHIYFDGYFLPTMSPLWLSEGMAVYTQILASKQRPYWIDQNLRLILQGNALIPFEEMMSVETISNYSQEQAGLWYTQAYSTVDYLLNKRSRNEFYTFCNELKAQTPVYQALYRAYGMPFNKVSSLENAWLHDLKKAYQQELFNQAETAVPQTQPAQA